MRTWKTATALDWGGMLMRPRMRGFAPNEHAHAGTVPGIYLLGDDTERMVYIGKAGNLASRLRQHRDAARFRNGLRFAFFCFLPLPQYAVRDVEVAHIHALEPPANRLYEPPHWPGHQAMVTALQAVWSGCE